MTGLLEPTPTEDESTYPATRPASLVEALERAAGGNKGFNYYDARGRLVEVLSYHQLRERAEETGRRLRGIGLEPGARIAIALDTEPAFPILFFGCRYAGLVPVAMPMPVHLGSGRAYVEQLRGLILACDAALVVAGAEVERFAQEAIATGPGVPMHSPESLADLPPDTRPLPTSQPDDLAYLQFTSGSTRFSCGAEITERAVLSNLQATIDDGLHISASDRCASWLPYYHDMGLVGFMLTPVVAVMSVDFLKPRDFGVRPLQWLRIISTNRCTIAFGPPFGYDLCALRVRGSQLDELDLSSWRVAGVGAEMIQPAVLARFAERLAPTGFDPRAFVPAYGLAEACLAVSFAPLGEGIRTVTLDAERLSTLGRAEPPREDEARRLQFVDCGRVLQGLEVQIGDGHGHAMQERHVGRIMIRGPSLMRRYFRDPDQTRETLSADGWLDSGDLGCILDGRLVITGRRKDLIIVNGRNIRPEELEHLVETRLGVRAGNVSAFAVSNEEGADDVVLVLHCRLQAAQERAALGKQVRHLIYEHTGVQCVVDLVPPHTLPRTSSGKLSRSAARKDYLARVRHQHAPTRAALETAPSAA